MPASPSDRLRVGRVRRAHGTRGELRVEMLTDFPERFRPGGQLEVGGVRRAVRAARPAPPDVLLELEGVDAEQAAALAGEYLTVPLTEAMPLPPGRYYHYQLVGLDVWDIDGRHHGRLVEVLEYPGQMVFRALDGAREVLIPATQSAVREISLDGGRMLVHLPEAEEA